MSSYQQQKAPSVLPENPAVGGRLGVGLPSMFLGPRVYTMSLHPKSESTTPPLLRCPHCSRPHTHLDGVDTQSHKPNGCFPDKESARRHAVSADNIFPLECEACSREFWVAMMDQRW